MAGRCISVDAIAFGSTRNVPACTMTGEAAAIAAAFAAQARGGSVSAVPVGGRAGAAEANSASGWARPAKKCRRSCARRAEARIAKGTVYFPSVEKRCRFKAVAGRKR
jgi:hypothetical protein